MYTTKIQQYSKCPDTDISLMIFVRLLFFFSHMIIRSNHVFSHMIVRPNHVFSHMIVRPNHVFSHMIVRPNHVFSHMIGLVQLQQNKNQQSQFSILFLSRSMSFFSPFVPSASSKHL